MTNIEKTPKEKIESLVRKAEQTRYAHSCLKSQYEKWHRIISATVMVASFMLVFRVIGLHAKFANWQDELSIFSAAIAIFILLIPRISENFEWQSKIVEHTTAIHVWGQWIQSARLLSREAMSQEDIKDIHTKYEQCMESTALIPNEKFLMYKANFKIHVETSKEIDKCPSRELPQLMKKIRKMRKIP